MPIVKAVARGFKKVLSSKITQPPDAEINKGQEPEVSKRDSEVERDEADPARPLFLSPIAVPLNSPPPNPLSPPPPSSIIPQNILAFRFITQALSMIGLLSQPFKAIDNFSSRSFQAAEWSSRERREVKICDAFAHLAAAEYNIVAISTNWHQAYGRHSTLGVMAAEVPLPGPDLEDDLDDTLTGDLNQQPDQDSFLGAAFKAGKEICQGLLRTKWNIAFADNAQTEKHILNKRNSKGKGIIDSCVPPALFPALNSKPDVPTNFEDDYKGNFDAYMKDLLGRWYLQYLITLSRNTLTLILSQAGAIAVASSVDLRQIAYPASKRRDHVRIGESPMQTALQILACYLLQKDGPTVQISTITVLLRCSLEGGYKQIYFREEQPNRQRTT